jgi:Kinesin motor domain
MPLTNQESVYEQCGCKIKTDLMEGNAVVLFAYGLSGSGKTFTTFVSHILYLCQLPQVHSHISYSSSTLYAHVFSV